MLFQIVEQNQGALLPLFIAFVGASLIMYFLPRIAQFMKESTKDSDWIVTYRNIQLPLIFSILCYGGVELCFDIVIDAKEMDLTKAQAQAYRQQLQITSSVLLACFFVSGSLLLRRWSKARRWHFATLFVFCLYQGAASWNYVPFFWDTILQAQESKWGSLFAIPSAILIAIFFHFLSKLIIVPLLNKSRTNVDDLLFEHLERPIWVSIILIGFGYGLDGIKLPAILSDNVPSILLSVAIYLWGRAIFRLCDLGLKHIQNNQDRFAIVRPRTLPVFSLVSRFIITITGVYCILIAWDIDPSGWLASAGIIGIAVAYASQDTLSSLLAGVAILTDAPYKLGDFLVLENEYRGKVTHIGFRSTRLLTPDNVEIIIPNSIMSSTQIINMSGGPTPYARIDCAAGVAYGSDVQQVKKILYEIANELDYIVDKTEGTQPQVHFVSMGASSLDFILRIWIEEPHRFFDLQNQANTLIYERFTEAGIEIPYTKQDVYLYDMNREKDANGS